MMELIHIDIYNRMKKLRPLIMKYRFQNYSSFFVDYYVLIIESVTVLIFESQKISDE